MSTLMSWTADPGQTFRTPLYLYFYLGRLRIQSSTSPKGHSQSLLPPMFRSKLIVLYRYNATIWGPSGNITINGTLTYSGNSNTDGTLVKRGLGAGQEKQVNVNNPPYAIHNGTCRGILPAEII